jgi:hypothetical protein
MAVPIVVALLPIAAVSFGNGSHFHAVMLWLVVPTSIVGFGLGLRIHGRALIVGLGLIGVTVLATAAIWGHSAWPTSVEIVVSIIGSLVLGMAHWRNFRAVRRLHHHV